MLVYTPPSAPSNLSGKEQDGSIHLSWDEPQQDGGKQRLKYFLYIQRPDNSTELVNLSSTERSYLDDDLQNGASYNYRVSAFNGREGPPASTGPLSPFGRPTAPTNLEVETKIGQITLWWSYPEDDNGSEVIRYHVRYGSDSDDLDRHDSTENTWWAHSPEPTPGVKYHYSVTAENGRGEGDPATANGTTYSLVSEPRNGETTINGLQIQVSWASPLDWGGAQTLTYRISRRAVGGAWEELSILENETSYVDSDPRLKGGTFYEYRIEANNSRWGPELIIKSEQYFRVPGPVTNLTVEVESGYLLIRWDPPLDDGGYAIDKYQIERIGEGIFTVPDIRATEHRDHGALHNKTYGYCVVAKNRGPYDWGERCQEVQIAVEGRLGAVENLWSDLDGREVTLEWDEPGLMEFIEVQGYWIYRGVNVTGKEKVATIGNVTTWTDYDTVWDITYHYMVIPYHKDLTGAPANLTVVIPEKENGDGEEWWVTLVLIIALVTIMAVAYVFLRRRAEGEPEVVEPSDGEGAIPTPPWARPAGPTTPAQAEAPAAVAITAKDEGLLPYLVEEVFVVYSDGRLITSCAREECGTADADLMSGMLIAIQGLIQDGLESGGTLESIKYGENLISLATGDHVVLAAVVYGRPDEAFQEDLRKTVSNIEGTYAGIIEEWTGDPSAMEGLDGLVMPLIETTAYLTRDNVGDVLADHGVALLSAVDFFRGYVRLKMAAVNATFDTVIDSAMEIHYDPDMLRLERVEPDSIVIRGDRVTLGNIRPGERKTVALLFDPQICQSTHIDGHLSYYTSQGELRYVEMKRRTADVVCPVFFTRENANTAMLRKLMKETLHQNDLRLYRYPSGMRPDEVLAVCKTALGSDEIQLVREYIVEKPSYEAEVWYYAETRVKRYQFVIRLGVVEDKGVVELFAASTAMEPITGLLADFRRELNRILEERYAEDARLVDMRDDRLRRDLERRPLRLDSEED